MAFDIKTMSAPATNGDVADLAISVARALADIQLHLVTLSDKCGVELEEPKSLHESIEAIHANFLKLAGWTDDN